MLGLCELHLTTAQLNDGRSSSREFFVFRVCLVKAGGYDKAGDYAQKRDSGPLEEAVWRHKIGIRRLCHSCVMCIVESTVLAQNLVEFRLLCGCLVD